MSWSYQSNNCSVLVKEKQDGVRECPSPNLHLSSTETVSSADQVEISSLGNSVGGKRERFKRSSTHEDEVDVVLDGIGNNDEQRTSYEDDQKRILINISIVLDDGTRINQDIYKLQVEVPLPKEKKRKNFYSYESVKEFQNIHNNSLKNTTDSDLNFESQTTDATITETINGCFSTEGLNNNLPK
jgi:hypothetical protein